MSDIMFSESGQGLSMSSLGHGDGLPEIGGDALPITIEAHVRSCRVLLDEEQRRPNPDNALIATLCNSVRLAREHVACVRKQSLDMRETT